MIWVTSDNHFGHRNIINIQPRPEFLVNGEPDVEMMNNTMITRWNELVNPDDVVYHVGDFCWNKGAMRSVLHRLHGRIILIPGNHDKELLAAEEFRGRFEAIKPYSYYETNVNGEHVVFSHFPYFEWNQIGKGTWHLHGHLHAKPHGISGKIMDVGADGNGLRPYSWDQIKAYMDTREVRLHHGRNN